jgi:DNA polymerase III epsilon subunit-like protein
MTYIFFDTETTGLLENSLLPIDRQPHCIELYMLKCDEAGQQTESWHSMFKVNFRLPEEIIRITGIKDSDLINKPKFSDKIDSINYFIKDADYVVAHNLKYDLNIMDIEYARASRDLFSNNSFKRICTVEQTEYLNGYRLNLTSLHQLLFGQPFSGAHRAEEDVKAMAKCFFELKRRDLV